MDSETIRLGALLVALLVSTVAIITNPTVHAVVVNQPRALA